MGRSGCWPFIVLFLLIASSEAWGGDARVLNEKPYSMIENLQGNQLEGRPAGEPGDINPASKDKEEKPPSKVLDSITFEKVNPGIPGANLPSRDGFLSVRLRKSQEVFALKNRTSLNINTEVGVMFKDIDANTVQSFFGKSPAPGPTVQNSAPLIRDKSILFNLELKF